MVFSRFSLYETHGTEAVGRSVHSKTLSCLCVFRDGSEQRFRGGPVFTFCVSKLVNLFTLSDVCAELSFHVEGIKRKETRNSVFLQT